MKIEWLDESQSGYEIYLCRDDKGTIMVEVRRYKEQPIQAWVYGEPQLKRFSSFEEAKHHCEQELAHRFAEEICRGEL
jgi:hypothetical protein